MLVQETNCRTSLLSCRIVFPGGGVHNMLRVRLCAAHMGGFFGQNTLNKGPFSADFS